MRALTMLLSLWLTNFPGVLRMPNTADAASPRHRRLPATAAFLQIASPARCQATSRPAAGVPTREAADGIRTLPHAGAMS